VAAAGPADSTLPRGPPSTSSSTLVVATTELVGSTLQGGRHERLLHLRWWPLVDPLAAPLGDPPYVSSSSSVVAAAGLVGTPPGGPPLTSSTSSVVAVARPTGSTTHKPHHRCLLHLQWWLLLDLPVAHRRGPPSTSSTTLVVATAGPAGSNP
jgi:hypothetical protein